MACAFKLKCTWPCFHAAALLLHHRPGDGSFVHRHGMTLNQGWPQNQTYRECTCTQKVCMLLSSSCWKVLTSPDLTACAMLSSQGYQVGGQSFCPHLKFVAGQIQEAQAHLKSHDRPRLLTEVNMNVYMHPFGDCLHSRLLSALR